MLTHDPHFARLMTGQTNLDKIDIIFPPSWSFFACEYAYRYRILPGMRRIFPRCGSLTRRISSAGLTIDILHATFSTPPGVLTFIYLCIIMRYYSGAYLTSFRLRCEIRYLVKSRYTQAVKPAVPFVPSCARARYISAVTSVTFPAISRAFRAAQTMQIDSAMKALFRLEFPLFHPPGFSPSSKTNG